MKVLSLFDGMACGAIALKKAGIPIESYNAYEIDKYAIQTATHNFPFIQQCGDVFNADFSKHKGVDLLCGGSPCTYWSIAQKNNRETEASGLGWELFSQYVRALKEAEPKYFVYENNKSMSQAIRESITSTFGFEPICINSALVSAQNRQRLYWVGKRNEDGTYSRVDVKQPEDKGILLRDILERGNDLTTNDKAWTLTASYNGAVAWNTIERSRRNMAIEPVIFNTPHGFNEGGIKYDKSPTLTANGSRQSNNFISEPVCVQEQVYGRKAQDDGSYDRRYEARTDNKSGTLTGTMRQNALAEPVNVTSDGKSHTIKAQYYKNGVANFVTNGGHSASAVAEPVCVAQRGRYEATGSRSVKSDGPILQYYEARKDGKTNTLTTVQKDNYVAAPVRIGALPRPNGELSTSQAMRVYSVDGKSVNLVSGGGGMGSKTGLYAVPCKVGEVNGGGQGNRIYSVDGKAVSQTATSGGMGSNTGLYAIPVEYENGVPIKAQSLTDGKTYTVYEVKDGLITIKGKEYPIKLADGFYIIRKLTVTECKRLQTVPEWYEFPVSDTQAYKMLGNGWTVDVIVHILNNMLDCSINHKGE